MAKNENKPIEAPISKALDAVAAALAAYGHTWTPEERATFDRAEAVLKWAGKHKIRPHKSKSPKAKHPWHFSIIGANGEIVLPSEGYESRAGAKRQAAKHAALYGIQVQVEG